MTFFCLILQTKGPGPGGQIFPEAGNLGNQEERRGQQPKVGPAVSSYFKCNKIIGVYLKELCP